MKAPFPWHGGKSRVAPQVWHAFSGVRSYIEPFAGSLAVLLARNAPCEIETVNDLDCYVANFWRAVTAKPELVAEHAEHPINEADLHARHAWLVGQDAFRTRMHEDPDFYDVKVAGWWVWGVSLWMGANWCHESAAHYRKLPHLGAERGIHSDRIAKEGAAAVFARIMRRLRRTRVACGDWQRVLSDSVIASHASGGRAVGVLLDPPYDVGNMHYAAPGGVVSAVRDWALAHGDDPRLRIALCGYEGEFDMPDTWAVLAWKGHNGLAAADNPNATRERIWFSPHCAGSMTQATLGLE